MPSKKTFTNSDGAVERFFINSPKEPAQTQTESAVETTVCTGQPTERGLQQAPPTQKTPDMPHTQDSYDAQQAQAVPIIDSPAPEQRGRRKERVGLLLDGRLKEDLSHLSKATGSKSLNDFLVTLLTAYTESPENQERLTQYRRLLHD